MRLTSFSAALLFTVTSTIVGLSTDYGMANAGYFPETSDCRLSDVSSGLDIDDEIRMTGSVVHNIRTFNPRAMDTTSPISKSMDILDKKFDEYNAVGETINWDRLYPLLESTFKNDHREQLAAEYTVTVYSSAKTALQCGQVVDKAVFSTLVEWMCGLSSRNVVERPEVSSVGNDIRSYYKLLLLNALYQHTAGDSLKGSYPDPYVKIRNERPKQPAFNQKHENYGFSKELADVMRVFPHMSILPEINWSCITVDNLTAVSKPYIEKMITECWFFGCDLDGNKLDDIFKTVCYKFDSEITEIYREVFNVEPSVGAEKIIRCFEENYSPRQQETNLAIYLNRIWHAENDANKKLTTFIATMILQLNLRECMGARDDRDETELYNLTSVRKSFTLCMLDHYYENARLREEKLSVLYFISAILNYNYCDILAAEQGQGALRGIVDVVNEGIPSAAPQQVMLGMPETIGLQQQMMMTQPMPMMEPGVNGSAMMMTPQVYTPAPVSQNIVHPPFTSSVITTQAASVAPAAASSTNTVANAGVNCTSMMAC